MSHITESTKIARSYADSLNGLLVSEAHFDLVVYELGHLVPFLSSSEALEIWQSPQWSRREKADFLQDILADIADSFDGHQPVISLFLLVVLRASRMDLLNLIHRNLVAMSEQRKRIKSAHLRVAHSLSKTMEQEIKAAAEKIFQTKLRWQMSEDSSLMAGFCIDVGHTRFDGSMHAQLRRLKSYLHHHSQQL